MFFYDEVIRSIIPQCSSYSRRHVHLVIILFCANT